MHAVRICRLVCVYAPCTEDINLCVSLRMRASFALYATQVYSFLLT